MSLLDLTPYPAFEEEVAFIPITNGSGSKVKAKRLHIYATHIFTKLGGPINGTQEG